MTNKVFCYVHIFRIVYQMTLQLYKMIVLCGSCDAIDGDEY